MLRIGVDIGGTFTDFAAWREGSPDIYTTKVPSTPPQFAEGFKQGFEGVLAEFKPDAREAVYVVHGTTVSTNTVIERSGPAIALLTTKGFRDILELQRLRLRRPLNLNEQRIASLIPRSLVFEVTERIDHAGGVRTPIDLDEVRLAATAAREAGVRSLAIAFMHSYRTPDHERRALDAIAQAVPELDVTLSSDVWPRIGEYERAIVCVLNAYVRQKMNAYICDIEDYLLARLPGTRLFVTKSNGGLMSAREARALPVHTLLSGPAAGVSAVQSLGAAVGRANYLAMDMGGTSTDISLIREGVATVSSNAEVGDFPLIMPVTGIEAIGAGGGSIAAIDTGVLKVGPASAGARPGPACFMRGGELPTVTDAYLCSGFLNPTNFLGGAMKLDEAASKTSIEKIAVPLGMDGISAAQALIAVATSNMVASALPYLAKHGVDPDELTLVVYGGNGAIHGPLLADEIGIPRVLIPPTPSVFCAYGALVSDLVHDVVRTVHGTKMTDTLFARTVQELEHEAKRWLESQVSLDQLVSQNSALTIAMRYVGQSFDIDVHIPLGANPPRTELAVAHFHREHKRLFGYNNVQGKVEFVELRVRIMGALPAPSFEKLKRNSGRETATGYRTLHINGRKHAECPIYNRERLGVGYSLSGPAVIEQSDATILVPPDFSAEITTLGNVLLTRG